MTQMLIRDGSKETNWKTDQFLLCSFRSQGKNSKQNQVTKQCQSFIVNHTAYQYMYKKNYRRRGVEKSQRNYGIMASISKI